ncbi:30S ribosome-binding factor RbfA [Miltoncostaea marina]|uniref:30S ribosome-binding factor RbfA n=1 Tax=Miltoncostaea marina TaxID=2843215 RepID=UPI001C3DD4BA|nr:30S ribosome-binding factor RbfA [Miltoncostaea marina]
MARRPRSTRMRRVDTALRQVLAEAVGRELSDPRLGFVTITHVEATQDVREAKVWFTTLEESEREASQEALESARGVLQARLARELRSRHTPQLTFHYDSSQQDAVALTRLIDEVTRPEEGA